MRIGIDGRKIPQAAVRGPIGSLDHAVELGMDGVFFRTVLDMSPDLDPSLLAAIRERADELGLYLESGLGKVNPYASPETPELRRIGDGDIVRGFRRMMEACAAIDCRELWVGTANYKSIYAGRFSYDRFRTDVDWADQLKATEGFLQRLAPIARDLGIHLNLETHEEITSFELVRLIQAVGPDVLGIVYDTANPLQRIENPIRTAARVAPYVRQMHVKDAILCHGGGGLWYQMRPVGTGVMDFHQVLPIIAAANPGINLSIENDGSREDSPGAPPNMLVEVFHPDFLAAHPDLTVDEFAEYMQLVNDCEARIRVGEIPSREAYGAEPFGYRECVDFIRTSAEHLRDVCRAHDLPLTESAHQPI